MDPLVTRIALGTALLGATLSAQSAGLMYSTRVDERSNQCAGVGALNEVESNSLQYVEPTLTAVIRSQAVAPIRNHCTLVGDHDGDALWAEDKLFSAIDAVLRPRATDGSEIGPNQRNMFFSVRTRTKLSAGPTATFESGDVGRILPDGVLETFLSADQVRGFFGISGRVNVDAIALDLDPIYGGIFLSFEDTETIDTAAHPMTDVLDGAILRIPIGAVTFASSPYDGALVVATVTPPNVGEIVLSETLVDGMVASSGVADNSGSHPVTIGDVDGLTTGGWWDEGQIQTVAGTQVNHLWFSGTRLTGGTVLTTNGFGMIARLNGVVLGSDIESDGSSVGLVSAPVGSLNGLVRFDAGYDFVATDSDTGRLLGGGTARVQVGGLPSGTTTFLLWNFFASPAFGIDPALPLPFPTSHFPELFYSPIYTGVTSVVTGPRGCAYSSMVLPAGRYHVVCQSLSSLAAGTFALSSPCVLDVRPAADGGGPNPN